MKPKKYVPKEVPPFSYDLQTARIKKEHRLIPGALALLGNKVFKDEVAIADLIGDNPSICRELFGLGSTLSKMYSQGQQLFPEFSEFSNHVWIPQINWEDPMKRSLGVCINCGSIIMNNEFYSYLDVEAHEEKKKKIKS